MKPSLSFVSLAVLVTFIVPIMASANSETNAVYARVVRAAAANDIQDIISALPEIEKLWPNEPVTYFESVEKAASVLRGAVGPNEKQAAVSLFDSLLAKSCPTNNSQAYVCFKQKKETILYLLKFDGIKDNKPRMLALARFVGEIRSRMIPNYT